MAVISSCCSCGGNESNVASSRDAVSDIAYPPLNVDLHYKHRDAAGGNPLERCRDAPIGRDRATRPMEGDALAGELVRYRARDVG